MGRSSKFWIWNIVRGGSFRVQARLGAYIGDAGDDRAFELALVQFLHGSLQVVGGFKFHKPWFNVNGMEELQNMTGSPTLCPVHGQSRNKPRPVQTGGRNLSSPI